MMSEEEDMLAKWAQRGNFRGENPRGGHGRGERGRKTQVWLVYME